MQRITTISVEDHEFVIPTQAILCREDMYVWRRSQACHDYFCFVKSLNDTIKGKSQSADCEKSLVVTEIAAMLEIIHEWIDEMQPTTLSIRARSEAFKLWHTRLENEAHGLLFDALPDEYWNSIIEITVYLMDSFGNPSHFNYGPRNEMAFVLFLSCLVKIGALTLRDKEGLVSVVFVRYIKVIHKLQTTYDLRYAQRHGIWGIDDAMYLPYIWGSSQLIGHPDIFPSCIVKPESIDMYTDDYMFLACVKHINEIRTGNFAEHSIQLWNLSGVPSWSIINDHLLDIRYQEDVMWKYQIIHKTLFGSLMTAEQCVRDPEWIFKYF